LSILNLSNHEVFRIVVPVLHVLEFHAVGFSNQVRSISLDELIQSFRDSIVFGTGFGDDKVEENDCAN